MKFGSTLLTLGLAIGATFAEPIPKAFGKRSLVQYTNVITAVQNQVLTVQGLFNSYTGGAAPALIAAGDALVALLGTSTTQVGTFTPLTISEGLSLVTPIEDLIADVNDTIDAAIAKEALLTTAGLNDEVLVNLQAQKSGSEALAAAITAKVPAELQDIAAELSAGVATAIQRGIDAYSD